MKKKRPSRRTPEERAAQQATKQALEARIAALTQELEAAGSAYTRVDRTEQLDLARRRIDSELGPRLDQA